ncbi:hypothetical protein AQUSIP_10800 [Aquicella siphonis]|uniref:Uncharacterized protein n=1 Tax=Aquicella siphonis TaxID=254247 RepID=A0A5E4PHC9_9COXI|nr:hypothetical protein AQUSIP_10800 [Aquicella siphonis]
MSEIQLPHDKKMRRRRMQGIKARGLLIVKLIVFAA